MMDNAAIVKALVKPLVWHEQTRAKGFITGQWWAEAMSGAYLISVYTTENDGCLLSLGHFMREADTRHPTLAAAQAAAEADYQARIAAALHIDKIAALVDVLSEPVATHRDADWITRRRVAIAAFRGIEDGAAPDCGIFCEEHSRQDDP